MKKYTIFDIAKILQLDEEFQNELKTKFNTYDDAKKCEIIETLWSVLFELHDKLTVVRYNEFLKEIDDGKRELLNNLFLQAKRSVWQDFDQILAGKPKELEQIDEIRSKLEEIIKTPASINS